MYLHYRANPPSEIMLAQLWHMPVCAHVHTHTQSWSIIQNEGLCECTEKNGVHGKYLMIWKKNLQCFNFEKVNYKNGSVCLCVCVRERVSAQMCVNSRLAGSDGCLTNSRESTAPSCGHSESLWTSEASARQMGHVLLAWGRTEDSALASRGDSISRHISAPKWKTRAGNQNSSLLEFTGLLVLIWLLVGWMVMTQVSWCLS